LESDPNYSYDARDGAPKKTLYQILGVPRDANNLDIGMAHDRRVQEMDRTVHPDPSQAALVQQAWEILSDPNRRAAYDARLVTAAELKAAAEQAAPDLEIVARRRKRRSPRSRSSPSRSP
jgi:DnaJ-class molecular chaperone